MKCLEKDRKRRYETASELAIDLQRYLADEPVHARPPSKAYLLRKFVRRNRGSVISVCLLLLALVGGIIGTTWGMIRSEQAREDAVAAQETLASIIQDIDPLAADNEGVSLGALLGRRLRNAAQQLDGEVVGDPLVVARLQHVLGVALRELGHLQHAEAVLAKACQTRVRLLGDDNLDTVATKHELALVYREQAKFDLAETLYVEALATRTARLGPDDPETLNTQHHLGMLYYSRGKHELAETLFKEVIKLRTARLGADDPDTLSSRHRLALVYRSQSRFELAETLCREVLERRTATLGDSHLDTLASKHFLAVLYGIMRKFHLAEPLYHEVLRMRTAKQSADHPDTLTSKHHLGQLYASMDKPDRAIPLLEETLALRKTTLGPEHPTTLDTQTDLGVNYCNAGRQADGIAMLEEVHQRGNKDRRVARVASILLGAYLHAGKTTEARNLAAQLVETTRHEFPAESLEHFAALADAGWLLLEAKLYAEAEPLLREALSRGDKFFADSWRTPHARLLLGVALLGQQKFADAEPLLARGYEATLKAQIPKESGAPLDQAVQWAFGLYEASGQPDKAAEWRTGLKE